MSAGSPEGRRALVCFGGVASITAFIPCPVDRVMFIAMTTVHNVLLRMEDEFRFGSVYFVLLLVLQ